jgi:tetratricopeptide (TPR) repeat protein
MFKWIKDIFSGQSKPVIISIEGEVDERALELVSLGDKMFTAEDYQGAMDAYESSLRVDGHCAEAWYRRGRCFMHEENLLHAGACFVRSLELDSQLADAWCGLGETILGFIEEDKEPLFIRENRAELLGEANEDFDKALKLGRDLPKAKEGREKCRALIKEDSFRLKKPRLFSFQSGGILEKAKRKVVSPFLKPGDYRRKAPPAKSNA